MSATAKRWVIRVGQEYVLEAETADLALEIGRLLEQRTFQGIAPSEARVVISPVLEEQPL